MATPTRKERRFLPRLEGRGLRATDVMSPKQFRESEGVEDWRVLADGAYA